MRYSEALSLSCNLKAVTVSKRDLASARLEILEILARWSPQVEACPFDQGSFWLGAAGLAGLYGTEAQWGVSIREALAERCYRAVVVVGQTRGGTYILAKLRRRSTVIRSEEAENRAMADAPLSVVPLTMRHRRLLNKLGLKSLAEVFRIPPEELSRRFGPDLLRDLRLLEGYAKLPLQNGPAPDELVLCRRLESPVSDRQVLLPLLERQLQEALPLLARRARLLTELRIVFVLESQDLVSEVLRPAEPTTNLTTLVRLLDLRLARSVFPTSVVEIRLSFHDVVLPPSSGELFAPPTVRDLRKGAEAIALIRARWGNSCVVRPVLVDSHIPERSFRWEEVESLFPPSPQQTGTPFPTAVRRVRLGTAAETENPTGQRLGRACRLRTASAEQVIDKDYWFLRNGRREVAWVSWDRLNKTPRGEAVVD
jgi:protein ImuB